jgi:hypothetical protein
MIKESDKKGPDHGDISHIPAKLYHELVKIVCRRISSGQMISQRDMRELGNPYLVVIGGAKLKPENLLLKPHDYLLLDGVVFPGKSAMIDFYSLPQKDIISPKERDAYLHLATGRADMEKNGLYYAPLEQVEECGFKVFYTPVGGNDLHLRMVYQPHMDAHYPLSSPIQIPDYATRRLGRIWTKQRVG